MNYEVYIYEYINGPTLPHILISSFPLLQSYIPLYIYIPLLIYQEHNQINTKTPPTKTKTKKNASNQRR